MLRLYALTELQSKRVSLSKALVLLYDMMSKRNLGDLDLHLCPQVVLALLQLLYECIGSGGRAGFCYEPFAWL